MYSYMLDREFCTNCVMFGDEYTHNASKLKHIFCFNDHVEKYLFHNTAMEICLRMQNKESSVYIQLNQAVSKQV